MKKLLFASIVLSLCSMLCNAQSVNVRPGVVNEINSAQYRALFQSGKAPVRPALVDINADWCGWCVKLHPHVVALAQDYAGVVDFFQIDSERDKELIRSLGVNSYPTLIFITKDGAVKLDDNGYRPKDELDAAIRTNLLGHLKWK